MLDSEATLQSKAFWCANQKSDPSAAVKSTFLYQQWAEAQETEHEHSAATFRLLNGYLEVLSAPVAMATARAPQVGLPCWAWKRMCWKGAEAVTGLDCGHTKILILHEPVLVRLLELSTWNCWSFPDLCVSPMNILQLIISWLKWGSCF